MTCRLILMAGAACLFATGAAAAPNTSQTVIDRSPSVQGLSPDINQPDRFATDPSDPGEQTQQNPPAPGVEQLPGGGELIQTNPPLPGVEGDGGSSLQDAAETPGASNNGNRPSRDRPNRPPRQQSAQPARPAAPAQSYELICRTSVNFCRGQTSQRIPRGTKCFCGDREGQTQ